MEPRTRRYGAWTALVGLGMACGAPRLVRAQSDSTPGTARANQAGRDAAGRVTSDSTLREWVERMRLAGGGAGAPNAPREPVRCAGQPISDVVVLTQPPYAGGLLGRFRFVGQIARQLHSTTQPDVVRRFLVLSPGQPCDELRRAESERILRAQPFLVDARVVPYDDGAGGVRLEVETRDEFSAIVSVAARTSAPVVSHVRLGESNLMGAGVHAVADWYDGGFGYRDGIGGRLTHYQFLGRPYQLTVQGLRRDVGSHWDANVSHPFYTDLQRFAWRASGGGADDYLELRRDAPERNALFFRRRYGDVGGILRIGVPGRLSLFGASMSMENTSTSDRVAVLSDSGLRADDGPPLGFRPSERFIGQRTARVNALWGVRSVRFLRVTGFDALSGTQDVRRGFQLGTLVGRSVSLLGSHDDDVFVSGDLYLGMGSARSFAAVEVQGEGRQDNNRDEWNGIVASGRAAWYMVPDDRQRIVLGVEYGGAWRPRVPIQLALGEREGGMRGFRDAEASGARRIVARAEHRLVLGRPFGLGDLGIATFADAGRVWAGDAPYGETTTLQGAVGIGLLAAVPPNSRRLWRVDLAVPVTQERGPRRFRVTVSNRDLTRAFWAEPQDVHRARERAVPSSVFTWP